MYVKDLKKKILVIKNGGISRWTLIVMLIGFHAQAQNTLKLLVP